MSASNVNAQSLDEFPYSIYTTTGTITQANDTDAYHAQIFRSFSDTNLYAVRLTDSNVGCSPGSYAVLEEGNDPNTSSWIATSTYTARIEGDNSTSTCNGNNDMGFFFTDTPALDGQKYYVLKWYTADNGGFDNKPRRGATSTYAFGSWDSADGVTYSKNTDNLETVMYVNDSLQVAFYFPTGSTTTKDFAYWSLNIFNATSDVWEIHINYSRSTSTWDFEDIKAYNAVTNTEDPYLIRKTEKLWETGYPDPVTWYARVDAINRAGNSVANDTVTFQISPSTGVPLTLNKYEKAAFITFSGEGTEFCSNPTSTIDIIGCALFKPSNASIEFAGTIKDNYYQVFPFSLLNSLKTEVSNLSSSTLSSTTYKFQLNIAGQTSSITVASPTFLEDIFGLEIVNLYYNMILFLASMGFIAFVGWTIFKI